MSATNKDGEPLIPNCSSIGNDSLEQFAAALQSILTLRQVLIQEQATSPGAELVERWRTARVAAAAVFEMPLWGGSQAETVVDTVVLDSCEVGADVAVAGGPVGALVGAGIVLASLVVGELIWAFESQPPALIVAFTIEGTNGTLTITQAGNVTKVNIANDLLAMQAVLMMFEALEVSAKDLTDANTDKYVSELLIYTSEGESAWKESSSPCRVSAFLDPETGPGTTCAVGAQVNLWWRVVVNGAPESVAFSAWTVGGRQIDLISPPVQNQAAGTGSIIPSLGTVRVYQVGQPSLLPVAWLDLGELPVTCIGLTSAGLVVKGNGAYTIVGPTIISPGLMRYSQGVPIVQEVEAMGYEQLFTQQSLTSLVSVSCPLLLGLEE